MLTQLPVRLRATPQMEKPQTCWMQVLGFVGLRATVLGLGFRVQDVGVGLIRCV